MKNIAVAMAGSMAALMLSLVLNCSPARANASDTEITAQALTEAKDIAAVSVAPDHQQVAFRVQWYDLHANKSMWAWWVARLGDKRRGPEARKMDQGEEVSSFEPKGPDEEILWSPDSSWIYYRRLDRDGVQLWRSRSNGSVREKLTDDPADVGTFQLSPDGKTVFYEVQATRRELAEAEHREEQNGVLLGPTVELGTPLIGNNYYHGKQTTFRRDLAHGLTTLLPDTPRRVKLLDFKTRSVHVASASELRDYQALGAAAVDTIDNRSVTIRAIGNDDRHGGPTEPQDEGIVYRLGWKSINAAKECLDPACSGPYLASSGWFDGGQEILFSSMDEDGSTHLRAWNIASDQVRDIKTIDAVLGAEAPLIWTSKRCPLATDWLICTEAGTKEPPRIIAINLWNGTEKTIFDPNPALRAASEGESVQHLSWNDAQGKKHTGILVLPKTKDAGRLPLVITSYVCRGYLRGGSGSDVPEYILAQDKIAALCINDTRSAFTKDLISGLRSTLDGWEAAVDMLSGKGLVDPSRVGVSGYSLGSKVALFGISHTQRFAAAAGEGYDDDPINFYLGSRPITTWYFKTWSHLPPPFDDPDHRWQELSISLNASKIKTPILIQAEEHGSASIFQFYSTMVDAKKPIEVYVFPGENHSWHVPQHVLVRYLRNVDWFRFWLQGFEDPDPGKADQYRRWEAMKEANLGHN